MGNKREYIYKNRVDKHVVWDVKMHHYACAYCGKSLGRAQYKAFEERIGNHDAVVTKRLPLNLCKRRACMTMGSLAK